MSNDGNDPVSEPSSEAKRCTKCGYTKPVTDFYKGKNSDGLHSWCKGCTNERSRVRYLANRDYRKEYAKRYSRENKQKIADRLARKRKELDDYKIQQGCTDCGYNRFPEALDFDHLPGAEKLFNIGEGLARTHKKVWAEIAKCEVVCANCHRVRTRSRGEYSR